MEKLIYTVTRLYLNIRRVIVLIARLLKSMKHGFKSLLLCLLSVGVFILLWPVSTVKVKAYMEDLPYSGIDFENAYNKAITLNNGNVLLYYGGIYNPQTATLSGYVVVTYSTDVYLYKQSTNYVTGYTTVTGNTIIRPSYIEVFNNGDSTVVGTVNTSLYWPNTNTGYFNGNIHKSTRSGAQTLILIQENFQPTPTPEPTPTPVPIPTYEPVETPTPLPTQTPFPVVTPSPLPYTPGTETQLDYLYLTDFNLIRANRFFLAYGFTDSRYDSWTNQYEETTSGQVTGNFYVQGYENGNLVGNYSYYEYMQLRESGSLDWILRLPDAYNFHATVEGMGCRVTQYQGDYQPLEWICSYDDYGDYASGIPGTMDALLVIEPTGESSASNALEQYNGLLYMSQVDKGFELYGNDSGNGTVVATLSETTYQDGTSTNSVIWNTHSILNVTKRTRIYANVLYAPENLQCLNGFNDFEIGNEGFQYYSKTFTYNSDNPPVIVSLVYDGVYNSTVFTGGVLSYIPWKLENGEKIYTGQVHKDARISGGGVVQIAYFSDFSNGDIIGCDIFIDSGFGSIQPIYVGYYKQVPAEVYAIMHGVTQGQAQTEQIIENAQQIAQDMTTVNNTTVENGVIADTIQFADALDEKGYTYGFQQVAGLKNSLMAVEPQSRISLPAIFDTSKYWVLDLSVVEQNLPQLWTFGRGLIHIWLALNLISQGSALFSYIADDDEGEEMD